MVPKKTLIRQSSEHVYEQITTAMQDTENDRPAFHVTGVPGIGKSIFMVYFLCRYSKDQRFADKRFALEFDRYYEPTSAAGEYDVSQVCSHQFPYDDVIVFSDIAAVSEPYVRAKWLLIFSSPSPLRV